MIGWIILALLLVFIAVLAVRTLRFKPLKQEALPSEDIVFDGNAAVHALGELVQCKTVSYYDHSMEDDAEFEKLLGKLPELYPLVMQNCPLIRFDGRGLLFRWKGREEGDASVLMAHYDVVPVEEENWTVPAFEALIRDDRMWGRGTLDTKPTFNGILFAANTLMEQGFTPENDIYFAFSGGEEVSGPGAVNIVNWFRENHISLSMVLDEGGAVVEGAFPGVKVPAGMIGIAEKGKMNLTFENRSAGGHASSPAPHTPVGKLAMACAKLEAHPFQSHFTKPVLDMFDTLGRHSTLLYRVIFANMWCFRGVLDRICRSSGGELNALVRTTVAFTQMNGSKAPNVIPPVASMTANLRLNPEDTVESAIAYIKKVIGDDSITLIPEDADNPSPISRTDCDGYRRVKNAVEATWEGCVTAPYLMMQCSDSRHYGSISDRVYRFSAMDLTAEERHTIHGNDERIRLSTAKKAVEFFMRVMKQC